jgi:hypothetical protein
VTKDLEPRVAGDVEGYIMPVPIIPAAVEGNRYISSVVVDPDLLDLVVLAGETVGTTVFGHVP